MQLIGFFTTQAAKKKIKTEEKIPELFITDFSSRGKT